MLQGHTFEEMFAVTLCIAVLAMGVVELAILVVKGIFWALEHAAKAITRWTVNRWPDSGWKPLRKGKRWSR